MSDNPSCPCCQAHVDVARLTAERDADRACAAGFAAELAQAHDLLASAVPGGPLADRIRALLSLWAASVVEKAKLQRERDALRAEIAQARDILDALENETLVEAARDLAHEYETTNAAFHRIHARYWKGAVPALEQIANRDDAEMANARTLHYDMRGWARAALNVPLEASERPQDAPGRNDGAMTRTEDRTCPACRKDLEDNETIESLIDLNYKNGVAYAACPHCMQALKIEHEERYHHGTSDDFYTASIARGDFAAPTRDGRGGGG